MSCTSIAKCGAWAFGASLTAVIALGAFNAQAQEGFYFGPEGGWTGLQGTKTSVTGTNPVTGQSVTFPINQSFNSGWNVGARAGYQWGPWRFEGEYSHRQNGGDVTGPLGRLNGSFDTNSFMANGIYDFTLGWPITPHIGFGIGVVEANGTIKTTNFGEFSKTSDTLFAYQAIAGFRYMFTPSLALDLDYRYRGSSDATWKTRAFTLNGVNFPSKTFSGSTNTNNVVASLTWLFVPHLRRRLRRRNQSPIRPRHRLRFRVSADSSAKLTRERRLPCQGSRSQPPGR